MNVADVMNAPWESIMDSNRLEGIGHQVKGVLKERLGKIIGDAKLTADGAAERAAGPAQNVAGPEGENVIWIDTDRIVGVGHQLKGAIKEGLGKLVGEPELVAEGGRRSVMPASSRMQPAAPGTPLARPRRLPKRQSTRLTHRSIDRSRAGALEDRRHARFISDSHSKIVRFR
jgi:uncharacterized protein YjbJ (UPF0337 family)